MMHWTFTLRQAGMIVARGSASTEVDCRREASHYAMLYEQGGPVLVRVRKPRTMSTTLTTGSNRSSQVKGPRMDSHPIPAPGAVGMFRKSGNLVRVVRLCDERTHQGLLEVERVDGGKRMLISPAAFVPEAELVDGR